MSLSRCISYYMSFYYKRYKLRVAAVAVPNDGVYKGDAELCKSPEVIRAHIYRYIEASCARRRIYLQITAAW